MRRLSQTVPTPLKPMSQDYKPESPAAALSIALLLAITAPSEGMAAKAFKLADKVAHQIDDEAQINAVKDSVEACLAYFKGGPA